MYEFKVIKYGSAEYEGVSGSMHHLRWQVFHNELKWTEGLIINDEKESDIYDAPGAYYIVRINGAGEVDATCRLIPTNVDYMLADHYAHFITEQNVPNSPLIWEISRACVSETAKAQAARNKEPNVISQLIVGAIEFGLVQDIKHYISLTTDTLYPFLHRVVGWDSKPLGPKMKTPDDVSYSLIHTVSYDRLQVIRKKNGISLPLIYDFDENIQNIREVTYDTPPIPKDGPPPTGAAGGFHSGHNPSPFLS